MSRIAYGIENIETLLTERGNRTKVGRDEIHSSAYLRGGLPVFGKVYPLQRACLCYTSPSLH